MATNRFLAVTALAEGATGLALLLVPTLPLALLLGLADPVPQTALVARVAGVAILAIAVTAGLARADPGGPALRAVVGGLLVYDVAVAGVLAWAGAGLGLAGPLLWPAVVAHFALAAWGVSSARGCLAERAG